MFTPQMIAELTQKEGTYHFFKIKWTALSLMVPNVGSKWKQKKDAVNTFKVSTITVGYSLSPLRYLASH
jgi:hypothetical protein